MLMRVDVLLLEWPQMPSTLQQPAARCHRYVIYQNWLWITFRLLSQPEALPLGSWLTGLGMVNSYIKFRFRVLLGFVEGEMPETSKSMVPWNFRSIINSIHLWSDAGCVSVGLDIQWWDSSMFCYFRWWFWNAGRICKSMMLTRKCFT